MSSSHQHLDVPISTQPMPSMHDYVLTIPFEASSRPSRKRHTKIMSQAAERWGWFSRARHLDEERSTWLGTLGYFPFEIREQIIDIVLKPHYNRTILWPERASEERNRKQNKITCSALSLTCPKQYGLTETRNLAQASPDLEREVRGLLLRKGVLRFLCPRVFSLFLDGLEPYKHLLLQFIELVIPRGCNSVDLLGACCDCWDSTDIFSQLPRSLERLCFKLDYGWRIYLEPVPYVAMGISGGFSDIDYTVGLLDFYTKQAERCVPEANVSIGFSFVILSQKIQDTLNTIFDELD